MKRNSKVLGITVDNLTLRNREQGIRGVRYMRYFGTLGKAFSSLAKPFKKNTINFFNAVCTYFSSALASNALYKTKKNKKTKQKQEPKENKSMEVQDWLRHHGLVFFPLEVFKSGFRCVCFHMSACRNQSSKRTLDS